MSFIICEKRRSIINEIGHCLVLGGPGSGKTTLALLKALRCSEDNLQPGQSILMLSFSRAAVARVADAAKRDLPRDRLNLLSIQTFHSFFWQILQGHGYLLGAPRPLRILQAHEEASLRDGIKQGQPGWKEWEQQRSKMFSEKGLICFDLFAPLAAEILTRATRLKRRISQRFPLILVDEAQDTNEQQWQCIRLLSNHSQIVCFADPDQMIYGHLPGVSANRLPEIREALKPYEVDLGTENNRSSGTQITQFARDVYSGRTTDGNGYSGVSYIAFSRTPESRDKAIRSGIGIIRKRIIDQTGSAPESIAILASYTKGVAIISGALQKDKAIQHQVLFDESFALLSARAAAFVMEPKLPSAHADDVACLLELAGAAFRCQGTAKGREIHERCLDYARRIRVGQFPKVSLVRAAVTIIEEACSKHREGDPRKDWLAVKRIMHSSNESVFREMASQLDYLITFARGKRIAEALSSVWMENGAYEDARGVLDAALAQDQLLSTGGSGDGIHVMNTHKAKGKQFDGVVLYRQEHHSPFLWRSEAAPQTESRRLLHMAITRARKHVLILSEAFPACPILKPYRFGNAKKKVKRPRR